MDNGPQSLPPKRATRTRKLPERLNDDSVQLYAYNPLSEEVASSTSDAHNEIAKHSSTILFQTSTVKENHPHKMPSSTRDVPRTYKKRRVDVHESVSTSDPRDVPHPSTEVPTVADAASHATLGPVLTKLAAQQKRGKATRKKRALKSPTPQPPRRDAYLNEVVKYHKDLVGAINQKSSMPWYARTDGIVSTTFLLSAHM
ncbi:MAG: hypothetical protein ACRYGR_08230 [Janthinobacterium lividum]